MLQYKQVSSTQIHNYSYIRYKKITFILHFFPPKLHDSKKYLSIASWQHKSLRSNSIGYNIIYVFLVMFQATKYTQHGETNTYVDGGLICNYPVHCFDGKSVKYKQNFILSFHLALLLCVIGNLAAHSYFVRQMLHNILH